MNVIYVSMMILTLKYILYKYNENALYKKHLATLILTYDTNIF